MLDLYYLIPQPWRDRVGATFVIGFFLALVGRKLGAALVRRGSKSRIARALVELGPGLRAVGDTVGPYLPPPMRRAMDSLTESDAPAADPEATPVTKVPRGEP